MVGKLIKNGFKDSSQAYVPVFTLIAVSTVLALLNVWTVDELSLRFISGILNLIIFGLIVAIGVLSYRANIYVLYTSIYKKNSYRLFTLPVKSWEILISKLVVAFVWSFLVGIATLFSIFIIISVVGADLGIIWELTKTSLEGLKIAFSNPATLILMADLLVRVLWGYALILFASSIAHSSWIHKNRGIMTFIIFLLTLVFLSKISALFGADMATYLATFDVVELIEGNLMIETGPMIWILFYEILVVVFLSIGTVWMWDHKLEII
ncbi:MAG TPA: hypothetical protein VIG45_05930 [Erysipelothrix sp.]